MELATEVIALLVVLVVLIVSGTALLLRGREGDVELDEEMETELERGREPVPPPTGRPPTDLEGVEPPQETDQGRGGVAVDERPLPEPAPGATRAPRPAGLVEDEETAEAPLTLAERFRLRLARARTSLGGSVATIFRRGLDEEAFEDLEESLISADVGVEATMEIVEGLRARVREEKVTDPDRALEILKEVLRLELQVTDRTLHRAADGSTKWLVTGVNGTGKTTTIGKIAARHEREGETVVLAAADTFRAAAAEQLEAWGERAGVRVVRGAEGADPASVAFDGRKAAEAAGADLLLIDTAGRLQNKKSLMDELAKVKRVVERDVAACDEVLLVLDATTGQNGLAQARAFMDAVDVSGVVLTKLDGTAKGGIVIAIQRQLGLPVKLVGLGEQIDDLADFDPDAFVDALFSEVAQTVDEEV